MSNKVKKKCCICGQYDEPRYQAYEGFVCSDTCLNQCETTIEDRISSHKCEVCGKDISKCRIEDVYVSPDYNSTDDRDIVFLCSTDCYAYYNDLLVHETSDYARLDNIVQKRKEAERAYIRAALGMNSRVKDPIKDPSFNQKKLSDEEAKEISDKIIHRINDILTDRIKDMCGIDIDNK